MAKKKSDSVVLGLDVSTSTGWALSGPGILQYGSWKTPPQEGNRFERWDYYAKNLTEMLIVEDPDFAVIEGYGYANRFTLVPLVEIGSLLREVLTRYNVPWVEVPPTTLKAYATGSGSAKKKHMLKAAETLLGVTTKDHDACDALWLAQFGQHLLGSEPLGMPMKSHSTVRSWKRVHRKDTQLQLALNS